MTPNTAKVGLILGQHISQEVQFVFAEIERQGHLPVVVDTSTLSKQVDIEYRVDDESLGLVVGGHKLPISRIRGVYWASVNAPIIELGQNVDASSPDCLLNQVVTDPSMDVACLLQLLFAQADVNWVNSFGAIQMHRLKPKQLALAKRLGANVPATYIGKCPISICEFLKHHPQAIVKPVFAGGHTKRIPPQLTTLAAINIWAQYPHTLQRFIPGCNVRTYIVGTFMVSAKIEETYLDSRPTIVSDYREASRVQLVPINMPIGVQQLAMKIKKAFDLQYTAIDWRVTPNGDYYFLEANPAPLFVSAQHQLGVDIGRAIVSLMFQ